MRIWAILRRIFIMILGMAVLVGCTVGLQIGLHSVQASSIVAAVVVVPVLLVLYVAYERFVERRAATELRGRGFAPLLFGGTAFGIMLFAVTIGLIAAAGVYGIDRIGSSTGVLNVFAAMVIAAVFEELLFRGFLFRTLRDLGGLWFAVAGSAIFFGAAHAFNPGASPISTIAIALEAGILLALAYAATNSLWFPIGLHFGWNFAESAIFGTPVSGQTVKATLFHGNLHGPALVTGGAFGPEASIAAIAVCLAASAFLVTRLRKSSPRTASAAF